MLSFISGNYTDLYQLAMGEVYFLEGKHDKPVCFDYFYRKIPNQGGYLLFAGLQDLLSVLENLRFTQEDLRFLKQLNFKPAFLEFLQGFRFKCTVSSAREGEIVFPGCPILRVEGSLIEAQLVETLLLNILNFESLVATKASRMRYVAGDKELSEFGFRRAQGPGAILATRAAMIGGFNSTSNVYAGELYGFQTSGTMAHSFIESYESELEAFRAFGRLRPNNCVFLADTFDTLQSGVPNAITVAKEMEAAGARALGIRLDSGDLAWLSKNARSMMDEAGLPYMKIVVSNQLDEFVIRSLQEQGAPIDVFGVGTRLVTGFPDAALDGVYKLSMYETKPAIKLSDSIQKTTLPGIKQVQRVFDKQGMFFGADAIILDGEAQPAIIYHPFESGKSLDIGHLQQQPILHQVMQHGKALSAAPSTDEIATYARERLALLPAEYKRFENPHIYKTSVSENLLTLRNTLRDRHR